LTVKLISLNFLRECHWWIIHRILNVMNSWRIDNLSDRQERQCEGPLWPIDWWHIACDGSRTTPSSIWISISSPCASWCFFSFSFSIGFMSMNQWHTGCYGNGPVGGWRNEIPHQSARPTFPPNGTWKIIRPNILKFNSIWKNQWRSTRLKLFNLRIFLEIRSDFIYQRIRLSFIPIDSSRKVLFKVFSVQLVSITRSSRKSLNRWSKQMIRGSPVESVQRVIWVNKWGDRETVDRNQKGKQHKV